MVEIQNAFDKLKVDKDSFLKTKRVKPSDRIEKYGPHVVKLPKSAVPEYLNLTPYQQFCWKTLGPIVKKKGVENQDLEEDLLAAQMKIRVEEYIAFVWMSTILALVGGGIAGIFIGPILDAFLNFGWLLIGAGAIVAIAAPAVTYLGLMASPGMQAKSRGKKIDKKLPDAMSFIASMASANINIDLIFKELSKQPLYGEVQKEADWITRDTELLGIDILTALQRAADRTPSEKFRDFIQGVITTSSSGGQLKPYFTNKLQEYQEQRKLVVQQKMETLGMMAESFVTVVVAFPLFLVVIMAIMALMGGMGGGDPIPLLYGVVGIMIPGAQIGFIMIIWLINQD
ncbi:MAG: type II secretion system F family protein [Candidatus Saliniplasma sp.]